MCCVVLRRIFPRAQRAQVFSMGQLRVLSTRDGTAPGTTSQLQQQQLTHSPAGGGSPPSPFFTQQQQQTTHSVSVGLLSARISAEQAAAEAAAAAAVAKQAAQVVPLQDHPNVATSGSPAAGPLGVLQLTLQVRATGELCRLLDCCFNTHEGDLPVTVTCSVVDAEAVLLLWAAYLLPSRSQTRSSALQTQQRHPYH